MNRLNGLTCNFVKKKFIIIYIFWKIRREGALIRNNTVYMFIHTTTYKDEKTSFHEKTYINLFLYMCALVSQVSFKGDLGHGGCTGSSMVTAASGKLSL